MPAIAILNLENHEVILVGWFKRAETHRYATFCHISQSDSKISILFFKMALSSLTDLFGMYLDLVLLARLAKILAT